MHMTYRGPHELNLEECYKSRSAASATPTNSTTLSPNKPVYDRRIWWTEFGEVGFQGAKGWQPTERLAVSIWRQVSNPNTPCKELLGRVKVTFWMERCVETIV